MKTVIIPDVHHRVAAVDTILSFEKPDRTIFLGDWFDDFNDHCGHSAATANWLVRRMESNSRDIFLWGNHDLAYAFPSGETINEGHTYLKEAVIREIVRRQHWERFKWYHYENNWLFSHGGLSRYHVGNIANIPGWLAGQAKQADFAVRGSKLHWFYRPGYRSGDYVDEGGLIWSRPRQFRPVSGLNQMFGHTPCNEPLLIEKGDHIDYDFVGENYCIDTHMRHYAVFDGSAVTIKAIESLAPRQ